MEEWLANLQQAQVVVFDLFAGMGSLKVAFEYLASADKDMQHVIRKNTFTIMFEVLKRCQDLLCYHHTTPSCILSTVEDSDGVSGSVLALLDNNFTLLRRICSLAANARIFLFVGGSPCVGFTNQNPRARGIEDARSRLVLTFPVLAAAAQRFRPDAAVEMLVENVLGSAQACLGISRCTGVPVWHGDAGDILGISRPRGFWATFQNNKGLPHKPVSPSFWADVDLNFEHASSCTPPPTVEIHDGLEAMAVLQHGDKLSEMILDDGWVPLWKLLPEQNRPIPRCFATLLRPFEPGAPLEFPEAYPRYPLNRYTRRGLVVRSDLSAAERREVIHRCSQAWSFGLKDIQVPGSDALQVMGPFVRWIHVEGGNRLVRPLNADERDRGSGFACGASALPGDSLLRDGNWVERARATGNCFAPHIVAHLLGGIFGPASRGALPGSAGIHRGVSRYPLTSLAMALDAFKGIGPHGDLQVLPCKRPEPTAEADGCPSGSPGGPSAVGEQTGKNQKPRLEAPRTSPVVLGVGLGIASDRLEKPVMQENFAGDAVKNKFRDATHILPLGTEPWTKRCIRRQMRLGPRNLGGYRAWSMRWLRGHAKRLWPKSVEMVRSAHPDVRAVLLQTGKKGCHIALLEFLLHKMKWPGADALISSMLGGFPLVDDIPTVTHAVPSPVRNPVRHSSSLKGSTAGAPVDEFSSVDREVWRQTQDEIIIGRIAHPKKHIKRATVIRTRRFGIYQRSSKGKMKVRCIDDYARSRVNSTTRVAGRIRMGRIADMCAFLQRMHKKFPGQRFRLYKSDFKSAYRACPISPAHAKFAYIEVKSPDGWVLLRQLAMPFGAVGAVYAWDHLGSAVQAIIADVLAIYMCRYVDDVFTAEFASLSWSARLQVLMLVELLGFTLCPEKSPLPHEEMVALGVRCSVSSGGAVKISMDPDKASVWIEELLSFAGGSQPSREVAARTAGRLSFAAFAVFGPRIRSRLRNLYRLASARGLDVAPAELEEDVMFLLDLLRDSSASSSVPLAAPVLAPIVIFTDAEGYGGVGAVLVVGPLVGAVARAGAVPVSISSGLNRRLTQIVAFELVVPAAAAWSWREVVAGRRIIFYIDNRSAMGILQNGRSRKADLNKIVFNSRDLFHSLHIQPYFRYVESARNCSDPVSRGALPPFGTLERHELCWPSLI